jgi:hypothetical protein
LDREPLELRSDRLAYLDREHRASVLLRQCENDSGFAMRRTLGEAGPGAGRS